MQKRISVRLREKTLDSDGFPTYVETEIATRRAYMEEKNMSEKWRNSAVFAEATVLFRFRFVGGITTKHNILCDGVYYDIISVENVHQRNMYLEIYAKRTEASNG